MQKGDSSGIPQIHLATCSFYSCFICYRSGIPLDGKAAHLAMDHPGETKKCNKCNKTIPTKQFKDHAAKCTFYHCHRCGKTKISLDVKAVHLASCRAATKQCRKCYSKIQTEQHAIHAAECQFYHCSRCRKGKIPLGSKAAHLAACHPVKTQCKKCNRTISSKQHKAHQADCNFYRCFRCGKNKIPLNSKAAHLAVCPPRASKTCSRRSKHFKDDSDFKSHFSSCKWRRCYKCHKHFPATISNGIKDHLDGCQWFRCTRCTKSFPLRSQKAHLARCKKYMCHKCGTVIAADPRIKQNHLATCQFADCARCGRRRIPLSCIYSHRDTCAFYICGRCRTSKIPLSEKNSHHAACNFYVCGRCQTAKIPIGEKDSHRAACAFYSCGRCGSAKLSLSTKAAHRATCLFYQCYQCKTPKIPLASKAAHRSVCQFFKCPKCLKARIPAEERAAHIANCQYSGRCQRCLKAVLRADISTHSTQCLTYRCRHCSQMLTCDEEEAHAATCLLYKCCKCHQRVLSSDRQNHRATCIRVSICFNCGDRLAGAIEQEQHAQECTVRRCRGCLQAFTCIELFTDHKGSCDTCVKPRCFEKRAGTGDSSLCLTHSRNEQDSINFTFAVMDPRTRFPVTSHIHRIMHAWTNEPRTTVVVDFEFGYRNNQGRQIYEIALANGLGEWVVPPTAINHNATTSALASRLSCHDFDAWLEGKCIQKTYGTVDDSFTSGLTFEEITDAIAQYSQKYGNIKVLLFWARSYTDFDCLQEILELSNRKELLPKMPRFEELPLTWWSLLRKALGSSVPLNLSSLFIRLFPEQVDLYRRRHSAGADVLMTVRLIEFYFRHLRDEPQPGKLENFFPSSSKLTVDESPDGADQGTSTAVTWELQLCEDHHIEAGLESEYPTDSEDMAVADLEMTESDEDDWESG